MRGASENERVIGRHRRPEIPALLARSGVGLAALALAASAVAAPAADVGGCGPTPYDCAVFHVGRREFGPALRLLEEVLRDAPRDLRALNLLGIALTGAGRIDEAQERFREALGVDPGFVPARKNLAVNEFTRGRLTEAQRLFEEVLERSPDDEIAHLHLGEIHFQRREPRSALPHYEKSRSRVAGNPTWTLHYAACLLGQGQTRKAVAALERLPEGDSASRFEAGVALGRSGAHAEAARFFGTARRGYKDPYAAAYNQTLMLIEAGDHEAAIRVAQEVLASGVQRAELYNLASRAHLGAGRIQEAYDALRAATRLEPAAEEHYVDLAMICLDHANYDLALEIVGVGLHYRPESSVLHLQRGALLAMKAHWSEAEKEFEEARRLGPGQTAPYAALALVWMQTGQAAKAVEVLREEARLRRDDHVIPYTFAVALMRSGIDPAGPEAGEAVEAFRASIRANPEFAPSRSELGRLLLKRDDVGGAIRELERAVALDPASTVAMYNLAQAYRKEGDRARAAQLLSRVSQLNAQERGEDPDADLKRTVVRIVREGASAPAGSPRVEP